MGIVKLDGICKSYGEQRVLTNFSYTFITGKITAITGPSGSGKSTLLNIIGLLERPDRGRVEIFNQSNINPATRRAMLLLRHKIGYLFQNFALIDNQTVKENLLVALAYRKGDKNRMIAKALENVGLAGFEKKKVYQCSGGEQQRIAVARLLLKPCELVLADEPTGSLDEGNKRTIFSLLRLLQESGKTIIVVSHDPEVIDLCHEKISLEDYKERMTAAN
ncbi:MAG: ATP-binding cassette domain-containing protein [Bacillota bacterium]|jgi:putative ABC transport system ATP-binding protein